MRNKYAGHCFRCNGWVDKGQGHPQRDRGRWLIVCLDCVEKHRTAKDAGRDKQWVEAGR